MAVGCLAAGLLAAVPATAADASTGNDDGFVSLHDFLADTASAGYQSFAAADTANQVRAQSASTRCAPTS